MSGDAVEVGGAEANSLTHSRTLESGMTLWQHDGMGHGMFESTHLADRDV